MDERRKTGKVKAIRALKLDDQEEKSRSKDQILCKVWILWTNDSQYVLHRGDSINIWLVKKDTVQLGKIGGGGVNVR